MKKLIIFVICTIAIVFITWIGLELPTNMEELKGNPPPGYVIVKSNYGRYSYKNDRGYIGFFDQTTRRGAVAWAWSMYNSENIKNTTKWEEIK